MPVLWFIDVSEERAKSIFILHGESTLLGNVCSLQYSQFKV
jgi:hypothetical protein